MTAPRPAPSRHAHTFARTCCCRPLHFFLVFLLFHVSTRTLNVEGACPPGSGPMSFRDFTGATNERRRWRFYGYFDGAYAMDSPGVSAAGGVQFDFNGSPNTGFILPDYWGGKGWHPYYYVSWARWESRHQYTWSWTDSAANYGQPTHKATYPAYEYDAHDVYMHDCTAFPTSTTCVQQGSEETCHGIAFHMESNVHDQHACRSAPDYSFYVTRSSPMYMIAGEEFNWNLIYKDDYHCGLIYEGKPVMNWADLASNAGRSGVTVLETDGDMGGGDFYLEIGRDTLPYLYEIDTAQSVSFVAPRDGYAKIACLVHKTEGTNSLRFQNNDETWGEAPCVGCEPGMFSVGGGSCTPCIGDTFQDLASMTGCKGCPAGKMVFQEPDPADLETTDFLPGLFRSKAEHCEPCPPGQYGLDGEGSGCGQCPAGFYREFPGAMSVHDCDACVFGQYGDTLGRASCKTCPRGTYTASDTNQHVQSCLTCAAGRYNDETGLGQSQCKGCDEGHFQPHGVGGDGTFGIKWDVGGDCHSEGTVIKTLSQSALIPCKDECTQNVGCIGISWNTANSECRLHNFLQCQRSDTSVTTSTFYERYAPTVCEACPPAKYQNQLLSKDCIDCPTATFAENLGNALAADCIPCPAGKFGTATYAQASGCMICPGGKYSSVSPAQSCEGVCSKGKYRPESNDHTDHNSEDDCILCEEKTFQDRPQQEKCLGCPAAQNPMNIEPSRPGGYFNSGEGIVETKEPCTETPCLNIECAGCKPGQYKTGEDENAPCANCPAGKYTDAVAQLECTECEQGYFNSSLRQSCLGCPRGQFGKSVAVSLRVNTGAACENCDAGKYNPNVGAANSDKCKSCGVGRYNENVGSPGAEDCEPCLPGKYSITPKSSSENNCIQCVKGRYSSDVAAASAQKCRQCPKGWYQGEDGMTACLLCVPGQATNVPESEACTDCVPGKVTENAGLSECMKCGKGKYAASEGQPVCFECTPGKYSKDVSNNVLNTKCESCPEGQSISTTGATACEFCPMGFAATNTGQMFCTKCLLGKATMGIRHDVTNETICGDCPTGLYADTYGSLQCKSCLKGAYAAAPGSVKCASCLPGQFSAVEMSEVCEACVPGLYAESESTSECTTCGAGFWSGSSAIACLACLPGKHAPNGSAIECTDCGTGYYSPQPESTVCTECAAGTWSGESAISCQNCPKGYVQPMPHSNQCIDCFSGYFSHQPGMANCSGCAAGTWSSANAISCQICPKGSAQPLAHKDRCIDCQSGYFSDQPGMANCSGCIAGTWSGANAISCQICAKGRVQPQAYQDRCLNCLAGTYQELVGASNCSHCPAGWAANSAESPKCGPCVEGRFSASTKNEVCTRCPIGWATGEPLSSNCTMCTAGKAQGDIGGTSCRDCQAGFFSVANESSTCQACQGGFYQPNIEQHTCLACVKGTYSQTASAFCIDIPDSTDVAPPRIVLAQVMFARETAVEGIPLDESINVRTVKITLEEPTPEIGQQEHNKGLQVAPIYTVVWWAQREDFAGEQEVGRVYATGWNSLTETVDRASTTEERYQQLVVTLPSSLSLYEKGFSLRLRAASYLNDTSWTRHGIAPTLPCPGLLGSGNTNLPCPPLAAGSTPVEPKLLHAEYVVPESGPAREAYESSLFRPMVPIIGSIRVTMRLAEFVQVRFDPDYDEVESDEDSLDGMNLRSLKPKCLFTQIEWSPDANFARLFVGARPACTVPGATISTTIDNFAQNLDGLSSSIFSYPSVEPLLYFRVRAYLDDTSTTSMVNPVLRFPRMVIREPQKIGDEAFAPQLLNNTIMDEWTLMLRLAPPTLRDPTKAHILFLEVQVSEKLQFRELLEVMYNGDTEAVACSRARNKSTVADLAFANTLTHVSEKINHFKDIDRHTASAHVPGCLVSDRIRIRINPQDSAAPVAVNVTFPESVYEQSYHFRVSAVLSDSSVILQDETYDNWGASSRTCMYANEYLQTHRDNDANWPYSSVEQLTCRACPLGASCTGDFVTFQDITARAGYRRLTWNQSVFGACPVPEACEGVRDVLDPKTGEVLGMGTLARGSKEELERCRPGHAQMSELCSDCVPRYLVRISASPPGTCSECPDGGTNFIMFFLLILVALGYMAFLIFDSLAGAKEMIQVDAPMPFHTIAIRILSSYLQVSGMLMSFRVTLPKAVMDLVTVQRSASAVVEQTLSFDCTAGSRRGLELFFMKQTMAVALPLMLPLVGCIWIFANAWKRMRKQKLIKYLNDKIVASIVVLYYLVFPAIVSRIAITFACTQYGDDGFKDNRQYLMQRSLTTRCYSTSHVVHIVTVTVPAIVLYMLLIPGYLMYELHRLRGKKVLYSESEHYEPGWTYRYGFLFAGYEPKYCHWEIIVLVRKAAFVLVTVFTRPAGMAAQVMAAVLVLILSLSAHIHFSPYDHDSHDALESAALHANLITLPVALLANEMSIVYGTGTTGEGGQQILGPAESLMFTLTAFSTFGLFVYLFFHGILMDRVDDPGLMGKASRTICKCWHKKDEAGRVLRVKSAKSKAVRRKTITEMVKSIHGEEAVRAHLVSMGLDPDEVDTEIERLNNEEKVTSGGGRGVGGGSVSQVKVQPIFPEEGHRTSSQWKGGGHQRSLVADTMGSAYLELLPKGVGRPSGAVAKKMAPSSESKGSTNRDLLPERMQNSSDAAEKEQESGGTFDHIMEAGMGSKSAASASPSAAAAEEKVVVVVGESLPQGWTERMDVSTERKYYVHTATGTSQWMRPTPTSDAAEKEKEPGLGNSGGEGSRGAVASAVPSVALQVDAPQMSPSSSAVIITPQNSPSASGNPVASIASPSTSNEAPWLQSDFIETLTLKQLKKAYKADKIAAKAEPENAIAIQKMYYEHKARYLQAKEKKARGSGSEHHDRDSGAAAAASVARRLSRKRNSRMKSSMVAGGVLAAVVKAKEQRQSIVL